MLWGISVTKVPVIQNRVYLASAHEACGLGDRRMTDHRTYSVSCADFQYIAKAPRQWRRPTVHFNRPPSAIRLQVAVLQSVDRQLSIFTSLGRYVVHSTSLRSRHIYQGPSWSTVLLHPPYILRKIAASDLPRIRSQILEYYEKHRENKVSGLTESNPSRHISEHGGRSREIYDSHNSDDLPGTLVCTEGSEPVKDRNLNSAYDAFNRNSIDDKEFTLKASVYFNTFEDDFGFSNAFWDEDLQQVVLGDGNGKPSISSLTVWWYKEQTVEKANWTLGETIFTITVKADGIHIMKKYKDYETIPCSERILSPNI
ncbi:hypothetical protein K469DRAFT_747958 [Zopfia rhizophila CBS 207.26]|uniref:Peptidase M4 domain-containing protein n=1 Tax=Zopfia rhizophila CBS 207.26 TaxID=1314779 RepID=A0A6A6EBL6_9PEZI|nr:hypothetical protein K469DRAFT_747958 [Zopfia rhizophila CBS 207.26]